MVENIIFIGILAAVLILIKIYAFNNFTKEKYQFFAIIPSGKEGTMWRGVNYTYYGVIIGFSVVFSLFWPLHASVWTL